MPESPRRALAVDDDAFSRSMMKSAVDRLGFDTEVASNAREAMQVMAGRPCPLVVLDLDLGQGPTGLELADTISSWYPTTAILLVTVFRSPGLVVPGAKVSGRYAYLVKDDISSLEVLRKAVEEAFNRVKRPGRPSTAGQVTEGTRTITRTQAEVLRLMAKGLSNEAIAASRVTTLRSVEATIQRLYDRLGLVSGGGFNPRVEAVRMYRASEISVDG